MNNIFPKYDKYIRIKGKILIYCNRKSVSKTNDSKEKNMKTPFKNVKVSLENKKRHGETWGRELLSISFSVFSTISLLNCMHISL